VAIEHAGGGGDVARVGWRGRIWLRALGEVVKRRGGGGLGRS
jgi:hypothetical protein